MHIFNKVEIRYTIVSLFYNLVWTKLAVVFLFPFHHSTLRNYCTVDSDTLFMPLISLVCGAEQYSVGHSSIIDIVIEGKESLDKLRKIILENIPELKGELK